MGSKYALYTILIINKGVQIRLRSKAFLDPPIFFQHEFGKSYKSTIIFYEHYTDRLYNYMVKLHEVFV